MKNSFFVISVAIFLISFFDLEAQNSYLKDRWNTKAGYAQYHGIYASDHGVRTSYANYRIELNYGLFRCLETGFYLGYSKMTTYLNPEISNGEFIFNNIDVPFVGTNLNFHPLSFFVKNPHFPLDFYFFGRYGGYYLNSPENYLPTKGFCFEMYHGAGLGVYMFKNIGIFIEGSFLGTDTQQWILGGGLIFRF